MSAARRTVGFTLLELMIALAIGMVGLAAGFVYARAQIHGFKGQGEVARMQTSSEVVLEGLARDIRNAGMGTSFYAGVGTGGGFAVSASVFDANARSRGFPAIHIANNVIGNSNVMPGSDAVMLLRITSEAASTTQQIPCPAAPGTSYTLMAGTGALLTCLASPDALVLVSDSTRPTGEPQAMLLAVDGPASGADAIQLKIGWGISPGDPSRCTNESTPSRGVATGSSVVCVQPSTYWIDPEARLRLWEPADGTQAATSVFVGGVAIVATTNALTARILAEGVEDLQFAALLSGDDTLPAALRNRWLFSGGPGDPSFDPRGMLAEARVIRVSASVRTTRGSENRGAIPELHSGGSLEDHPLTIDRRYVRRTVQFGAELRNMRLFDALSSKARGWDEIRSY